ncbi:hypothetical protein MtrunA17_Chr3g0077301 [Medicago truncatula]|uniref:Uncharacterized protein n=1 Tax=Medicago truncatula TaxID=3880 RepID=A0A396ILI1_MEDTR|nr:hypothetical protein MtrunA17_Chr3g0077301 [Medicago truncatula]
MIDTFRNKIYNCVLEDSSTGVGTVTGIYVDVVQKFQFLNKKKSLDLELEIDGFKLTGRVSKVGTGIKIVIDHTHLKERKYNGHYNFSAVGDQIRGIKTWLDFKIDARSDLTTSIMCRDLLEKSNGYVNSSGAFKIKNADKPITYCKY